MDKLDQLKANWDKQSFDRQYSKEELNAFLQKKSTTSIRWIFYLSLIEFSLYVSLPLLLPNYLESFDYYKTLNLYEFAITTTIIGYILLVYFMIVFFRNYKKISVSDSVKDHLQTILNTRKAVNRYIYLNLTILIVFLGVVMYHAFLYDQNFLDLKNQGVSPFLFLLTFGFIILGILTLFGCLYYFVYGRFLRPLKRNEKELLKF